MRSTLYNQYVCDIEVGSVSVNVALNSRADGSVLPKYTAVALSISAQLLFCAKNYSQTSQSPAVGVKYKHANSYIIT